MQYLAYKYGVNRVNQFFYENSIHAINPLLLNTTFLKQFNVSFEQSVKDFVVYTEKKYKGYKELETKSILASSKAQIHLSKQNDTIYFITSDLKTEKNLNTYDIKNDKNRSGKTTLQNGKVFKIENKLYTASLGYISPSLYKHGLFDENHYILESSIGKSINDIYKNKYANIKIDKSFLSSKLYIDDEYYSDISSGSLFDEYGNIYYFKQKNNTRILYKNKKKIYSFDAYFSKIVDVVENAVYFIANTENGSSLFKVYNGVLTKLSNSDNIIDAKIVNTQKAIAVTITANGYEVQKIQLKNQIEKTIFSQSTDIKVNDFHFNFDLNNTQLNSKKYNELSQLEFSMLYPSYSYNTQSQDTYMFTALFMDPVMFNMLNIYAYQDEDDTITGVNYTNERYIPFRVNIYNSKSTTETENDRNYGASFEVYGPVLKKGKHQINLSLTQYIDDDNKEKKPLVLSLKHLYMENFALASYSDFLSNIELLAKNDRGDFIYGVDYKLNQHIINELYLNGQIKSITSDVSVLGNSRGIKVVDDIFDKDDNTNMYIEGLDTSGYVKEIIKSSIGFSKVLNVSSYFSKFPISLRKESLFYNYAKYDITANTQFDVIEQIVGIKLDMLFAHKYTMPLTIKYIENDFSEDDYKIKVEFGYGF